MKHLPNLITGSRMMLCVPLFLAPALSPLFMTLYVLCGLSDVLDGFFARKLKAASKSGAVLDSAADLLFIGVTLFKILPVITLPYGVMIWIAAIACIRLASLGVGFLKYRAFSPLHTYANKATGVLLFCFPLLTAALNVVVPVVIVCVCASLSALEELVIVAHAKKLDRNVKSIFIR